MKLPIKFLQKALQIDSKSQHKLFESNTFTLCTDTRKLKARDVFIALKGEHFDGHDFVENALNYGAKLVIVEKSRKKKFSGNNIFAVSNTMQTYHEIAKQYLKSLPVTKVALTGSMGKTTTKEMIGCMMSGCLPAGSFYVNKSSYNNFFGVAHTIFQLSSKEQYAVFELGMNAFGEIETLTKLVEPDVGLITNVGIAHAGFLGGRVKDVACAKGELFKSLKQSAIMLVNLDDANCVEQSHNFSGRKITFGLHADANVRLLSTKTNWDFETLRSQVSFGQTASFMVQGKTFTAEIPLLGKYHAFNCLAALAVIVALKLDPKKALEKVCQLKPVPQRLCVNSHPSGAVIIDDTYNANPDSISAVLNLLEDFTKQRKIIVLGEITELGKETQSLHEEIGKKCHTSGINLLYTFGKAGKSYLVGAKNAGMPKANCVWAENQHKLAHMLSNTIGKNDIILFKGSRFSKTELVIEELLSINNQ